MNATVSKLILLYVLDLMEIPITSETLNEMCCSQNNWLSYMTLTQVLSELVDARFVVTTSNSNNRDGTYTTNLKIIDSLGSKLELKLIVANRAEAVTVYKKWDTSASDVYSALYKILIDGD